MSPIFTTQHPIPIVKWGPRRAIVQGKSSEDNKCSSCFTVHTHSLWFFISAAVSSSNFRS